MLSQDKNFGYFTTFHSVSPGAFLAGEKLLKSILAASIPEKRPMDDVPMAPDLPQEEEYAIGAFIPYAYYNGWCFPRNMAFYNNFVCMKNVPENIVEKWKETYLYLLKKATFCWNGKQLILKNPANTGRINLLLEMFPDAKFIHIYRNPYHVYFSMMKFLCIVLPRYTFQRPSKEEIERHMMNLYVEMYKKYLREKEKIPEGNLVEVKYEDFIKKPFEELRRIYSELDLKSFRESENAFKKFIASQSKIKTSKYEMKEEIKQKIYSKWQFAFDAFGYPP